VVARTTVAWVILAAFLALGVLSFLGDRVLSGIFIVVAGGVLIRQAKSLCPRCSNLDCAFNPNRPKATERAVDHDRTWSGDFSNLPITRTTVLPLLVTGPLAFIAAWKFSPSATIVLAAVALSAHTVFRRITCSQCGNDCAGNCNVHYREWKRAQGSAPG